MDAVKHEHFVELKVRLTRTISEELSEGRFNAMVDHFSQLEPVDMSELERIKRLKDVDLLLQLLERENQLSPDCVDSLEKLAEIADSPLAAQLIKEYKYYEKIEGNRCGSSPITGNKSNYGPRFDQCCADRNYNSITSTDAVPIDPIPQQKCPKQGEKCRRSLTKDREAAIEYVIKHLGRKWKDVAYKLDIFDDTRILYAELECIDDESRFLKDKIRRMFAMWVENRGNEATVEALIKALKSARNVMLAEDLEDGCHLGESDNEDYEQEEAVVPHREPVEG